MRSAPGNSGHSVNACKAEAAYKTLRIVKFAQRQNYISRYAGLSLKFPTDSLFIRGHFMTINRLLGSGRVPHVRLSVRGPKTAFFKCFHPMRDEFFPLARLIRRRRLHMIDDQNLHRRFVRFELQPKLLLNRREDRWRRRFSRNSAVRPCGRSGRVIWCPP